MQMGVLDRTPRRVPVLACVLLGALSVLGGPAMATTRSNEPAARPRAVVLVTIDTLRADGLSYHQGAAPRQSPYLDALAAEGIVFERAYAPCSWTAPSMASLFTGFEPPAHGVVSGFTARSRKKPKAERIVQNQPMLPQSFTTLAETFRSAGYTTVGIPSNRHLAEHLGFGQGFDYYGDSSFSDAPDVNQRVREQLERAFGPEWKARWKQEKVFLWIHYFDPHVPYFAREPWIVEYAPQFARDPLAYPAGWGLPEVSRMYQRLGSEFSDLLTPLYHSEVRFVDEHLRELDGELGLADDDTFLIVTSDHGEEFGEHGKIGHGQTLFEEAIRVPLFLRWPARFPESRRLDSPVSILGIYPTLTALLDLPTPDGMQGEPFGALLGKSPAQPRPLYFQTDRAGRTLNAVLDGPWKLIRQDGRPAKLFNLSTDSAETTDVAAAQPMIAQRLAKGLDEHLAALPAPPRDTGQVPVTDQGELEKLRALGYVE